MSWLKRKAAVTSPPPARTPDEVESDRLLAYISREMNAAMARAQEQALSELQERLRSEGINVKFT